MGTAVDEASTSRHPVTSANLRTDVWLGASMFVGAILSAALSHSSGLYHGEHTPAAVWWVVYGAVLGAALAVRRRFPCTVVFVVAVAFFLAGSLRLPELYVGNIALFIAMYTVGAWVNDRRRANLARTIVVIGMLVWLVVTTFLAATSGEEPDAGFEGAGAFSPFAAFMLLQFLINVAYFGGAWYFGNRSHAQATQMLLLEERTEELEHEREVTAAQAVALDRVRIARELHDVVAHHVSAMGVQAGAARTVIDGDPDAARSALVAIESSARAAIDDLRQLLDTLRTPDDGTPLASTVDLRALPELIAHANDNGLPTTLSVIGEPARAADVVEVNLYRVAQEALTNARRHGGREARADVRLRYLDEEIELEVTNAGTVHTGGRAGLGLLGMRERVAASGGTIEIGPRARGGFLVRARVPMAGARTGQRLRHGMEATA